MPFQQTQQALPEGLMFGGTKPFTHNPLLGTYLEHLKEPLDHNILQVILPHPLPELPKFKGEGDPNSHIKAYIMVARGLLPWDGVIGKIFPKTLEGITLALDWYY